jgi:periplasmic divalent cation tolerance protein
MPVFLILSTCPDADTAQRLARTLVEERLAACVNLLPGVVSTYRWQGQVEQATEVQLLAKTTGERREALIARLAGLHPYELPEILAVETAAGLPAYLDWVAADTRADARAPE